MIIAALLVLAAGTYLLKAAGPLLSAGRQLPERARTIADLLPAALLAALVASQTLGDGTALALDARALGVAAAGIAVVFRAPFAVVVLVGAVITAAARALGVA
ncbi:MAG: AzlD domain-containing protein [Nitriliruptoraceae bacterium]